MTCTVDRPGADGCLADVVRDVRGTRRGSVPRTDRLIDVRVVGDRALKHVCRTEPGLAHHPRDERGRPGESPTRRAVQRLGPHLVLAFQNPRAAGGHRPVAANRRSDALGLRGWQTPPAAPNRSRQIVLFIGCVVDNRETEEGPLLNRELDDATPRVSGRVGPARERADGHAARCPCDARRWRRHVEHLSRQAVERSRSAGRSQWRACPRRRAPSAATSHAGAWT